MIRVAIIGATGYTALEAAKLLSEHPEAEITVATSRQEVGTPLAHYHPALTGQTDVALEELDPQRVAARADLAFCCLPHGASAETVKQLVEAGMRVIDFSADFRLSSVALYEKWYGVKHPWPEKIGQVPYGLPELFADELKGATLVANPGCYPTSAILPLAPLLKAGCIEPEDIIVDSKSGVSGAGRTPKVGTLYCEANESLSAYAVGTHRHGPEIGDICGRAGGENADVLFTPHLTPMDRGILSTIYVSPRKSIEALRDVLDETYRDAPFVHVVDQLPATKHVSGTNRCHIALRDAGKRIVLVSAIDNLLKGASGAAVQNMNEMFGLPGATGLR